jgi:hypothetical protein
LEDSLDYQMMAIQQAKEELTRCVKSNIIDGATTLTASSIEAYINAQISEQFDGVLSKVIVPPPNGVDDTAAITAAFEEAGSNSHIEFYPGVYITDNTLALTGKNNITIIGYGATLYAKTGLTTGYALTLTNCSNVKIYGINFDRQNSYRSGVRLSGMLITDSSYVDIYDCDFSESSYGIANTGTCYRIGVHRCRQIGRLDYSASNVSDLLVAAQLLYLNATHTYGAVLEDCYSYQTYSLILTVTGSEDVSVINNYVSNTHDSSIYVNGPRSLITGNSVFYAGKDGIKTNGAGADEKARIYGNHVTYPGQHKSDGGVGIFSFGPYSEIFDNIVEVADPATLACSGTIGIAVSASSQLIKGNTIIGPGAEVSGATGISSNYSAGADIKDTVIAQNDISGIYQGISLLYIGATTYISSHTIIENNYVHDVHGAIKGGDSTDITRVLDFIVSNNTVKNYSTYGLYITGITRLTMAGNHSNADVGFTNGTFLRNNGNQGIIETGNISDGTETTFAVNSTSGAFSNLWWKRSGNYKGILPQEQSIVYGTGAVVADGTTAGKAKTTANVRYAINGLTYYKAATDDLFDLTAITTTASEYKKVLLCIDSGGTGRIIEGVAAATQAAAQVPKLFNDNNYAALGIVEIPNSYSGGDLAAVVFYDIVGRYED